MSNPVTVSKFQAKSHAAADEVRTPDKTRVEVVDLDGFTIARLTFQPGWRWSECIKPVVQTDKCQVSHVGHLISGSITVQMDSGERLTINAGDSYTIPPGHDAWVEGDTPAVGIEVLSADIYAKS